MEFLYEYGLFLLKVITFVAAIGVIVGILVSAGSRQKGVEVGTITVEKVNDRYDEMEDALKRAIYDEDRYKKEVKAKLKEKKSQKKLDKNSNLNASDKTEERRIFLVDFDGDIKASAVDQLREVVSAILFTASPNDEVVVRLESAGGMVHSYGLASSQLDRLRQRKIPLTICVDKVAASGGYMMACVGNKICAAPFAIIGSIGVVAQLPNFHKILKKNDIDYELLTAGEYKRTLTLFGENTEKGREKFVEDLELTHDLFKEYVKQQRPVVDIETVATGEIWFGIKAKDMQLIDELTTSDDYITSLAKDNAIFEVSYTTKKTLPERLGIGVQAAVERAITRTLNQLQASRFFR
ncbi:MAG: serine protease SohB [Cellvibrionaceae bacterium]